MSTSADQQQQQQPPYLHNPTLSVPNPIPRSSSHSQISSTDNRRTPSPGLTFCESMGIGGNNTEVPSPVPASVSSTASCSEQSSLQHSSSSSSMVANPFAPVVAVAPAPAWSHSPPPPHHHHHHYAPPPASHHAHAPHPGAHPHHPHSHAAAAHYHHAQAMAHHAPPPPYYAHQHHAPPPPPPQMTHHHHGHHHHGHPPAGAPHPGIPMVVSAPAPPSVAYHHSAPAPSGVTASTSNASLASTASSTTWAQRHESCPNFSIGTTNSEDNQSTSSSPKSKKTTKSSAKAPANAGRRRYNKTTTGSETGDVTDATTTSGTVVERRQKRLERNRESARLSRRRRKHYLEILEERVTHLSMEVDQGRRVHAAQAVTVLDQKRRHVLEGGNFVDIDKVRLLEYGLQRTSPEMMLVQTFQFQQLKSFALPPQTKFILWLTLQTDHYFRGGRAASERLSAARIGERMLNSGNDRVPPAHNMWPLFCNEVGLSYDQEERVRNYQRSLLQSQESWLERHTARAADLAMASVHDSTQAMSLRFGQRERSMLKILTPEQKVKFLMWSHANRERLAAVRAKTTASAVGDIDGSRPPMATPKPNTRFQCSPNSPLADNRFKTDPKQHTAANLYILNHRLQQVLKVLPRAAPLVTGILLKKLSRRPSFESLGRAPEKPDMDGCLTRDNSFASSNSLKRSASVMSMDEDGRPHLLQISPEDAQETARATVDKVLGYLKEIIPVPPKANSANGQPSYPAPTPSQYHPSSSNQPVVQHHHHAPPAPSHLQQPQVVPSTQHYQHPPQPQYAHTVHHHHAPPPGYAPPPAGAPYYHAPAPPPAAAAAAPSHAPPPAPTSAPAPPPVAIGHRKQSSFIPPYLNVVPEEMFPNDGTADEFLMSLVDEDWAIGEGIDMDTTQ